MDRCRQCFGTGNFCWMQLQLLRLKAATWSSIKKKIEERAGLSWQNGQLRSNSAHFLKNSLLPHTHALVSLQCAISAIQSVDKMLSQRDISHHIFTGDPLSSCQGSFHKCTGSGNLFFTQFSRHLTFQELCSSKCLFILQFRQIRLIVSNLIILLSQNLTINSFQKQKIIHAYFLK